MTRTLEELTGAAAVSGWTPDAAFADMIIGASFCGSKLSGVITAIDYDLAAGNGDVVKVRYSPARTAQGPMGSCGCLSAVSSTLSAYSITIKTYGDYDKLCGFSLYEAGPKTRDEILRTMAEALATKRDADIWTAIHSFKPTYWAQTNVACNSTATEADCCAYKYAKSLYNSVVSLIGTLQGACKNPDTLVLSPTVAKWFSFKDYTQAPEWNTTFNNGMIATLAGLNVVITGNADACNGTSGATMAVVLDSSRAVGEAWGKRPTFSEQYDNYCDYYKEVIWMYWGTAAFDTTAIGHVINA